MSDAGRRHRRRPAEPAGHGRHRRRAPRSAAAAGRRQRDWRRRRSSPSRERICRGRRGGSLGGPGRAARGARAALADPRLAGVLEPAISPSRPTPSTRGPTARRWSRPPLKRGVPAGESALSRFSISEPAAAACCWRCSASSTGTGLGIDLSQGALAIAEANARALGLADRARFRAAIGVGAWPGASTSFSAIRPIYPAARLPGSSPKWPGSIRWLALGRRAGRARCLSRAWRASCRGLLAGWSGFPRGRRRPRPMRQRRSWPTAACGPWRLPVRSRRPTGRAASSWPTGEAHKKQLERPRRPTRLTATEHAASAQGREAS